VYLIELQAGCILLNHRGSYLEQRRTKVHFGRRRVIAQIGALPPERCSDHECCSLCLFHVANITPHLCQHMQEAPNISLFKKLITFIYFFKIQVVVFLQQICPGQFSALVLPGHIWLGKFSPLVLPVQI
jgi:hypothetical protein